MANRRVVLTGMGTINPLAHDVEGFWEALLACKSGIRHIRRFDASSFTSRIGGEVQDWEDVPPGYLGNRESRRMDRFTKFAVVAAVDSVRDAGLDFAALTDPKTFIGRAPQQVTEFMATQVEPVRKRYADSLGAKGELNV